MGLLSILRSAISRMGEAAGFKLMFYGAIGLAIAVVIGAVALIASAD